MRRIVADEFERARIERPDLVIGAWAIPTILEHGTDEQRQRWLTEMLGGATIGAYSLSEPQAGSDAAALTCRATADGDGYRITGAKAWITHGGIADVYNTFLRTGEGSTSSTISARP